MTAFTVSTSSTATVAAPRADVWDALTDPDLLTRLTPYLHRIDAHHDGGVDRWTWHLARVPVLGAVVSPSFTELMTFDEPAQIGFAHDPERDDERAGVEGRYTLEEVSRGTHLGIDLAICLELPFPKIARPAVQTTMRAVIATMGARFSHNLVRHLERSH